MSKQVDVCIVGAGPAGMVTALQLLKAGRRVLVLERHGDFEREFRGEVLMPRFAQLFRQFGLEGLIEKAPHLKMKGARIHYGEWNFARLNFSRICPEVPYAMWMPQEALLTALHDECRRHPGFELLFDAKVSGIRRDGSRITGVTAVIAGEEVVVDAKVTVGADGRFSTIRRLGNFDLEFEHYNFDVIWFQTKRPPDYDPYVEFHFSDEFVYLIAPKHPDLLQVGLLAEKGGISGFRKIGVEGVRKKLLALHPLVHEFARELKDLTPFVPLHAKIERVRHWAQNGCVLIGDAAHTCSPMGAIGVSIAVGTAFVAAEVIDEGLRRGDTSEQWLSRIQRLREADVKYVQAFQQRAEGVVLFSRLRRFAPYPASVLSRLGILEKLVGSVLARSKPLPSGAGN